jgi:hypothetical protein
LGTLVCPQPALDAALAARALDLAAPSIERLLAEPAASGERLLHVVVLNPVLDPRALQPTAFERAILIERSFGRPPPWGADYRGFALAKARLAWRLQRDTRWVQEQAPHLLTTGDSVLWGSAVEDGLIVAASGAHPWFDEACCRIVLALLRGLVLERVRGQRGE